MDNNSTNNNSAAYLQGQLDAQLALTLELADLLGLRDKFAKQSMQTLSMLRDYSDEQMSPEDDKMRVQAITGVIATLRGLLLSEADDH